MTYETFDSIDQPTRSGISRRNLLKSAGLAAAAGALAPALVAAQATPSASPVAIGSGTLIEGYVGDPGLFAPIVDAERQTLLLFDTLVSTDAKTLSPQPNLAKSWDVSADGLTYTFHLDPTATFHDGQPFTSDDVKFTLDLLTNKDTASPYFSLFNPRIASTAAPDPATAVVTLSAPSPTFLGDLSAYSIGILPKHLLADVKPADLAASDFATSKPVGTGPFKFKEYRPSDAILLDPNPTYHRGAPKLEGYALKILSDATVAYQQLKTGEVDVTGVGADFYDDAKSQSNFSADVIDTFAINFLAFNQDATKGKAALKELPVRQALFYAIDRQLIIDSIYDGLGKVAIGTEPPATWAYQPDQITETYAYDPDKANSLLDSAGWAKGSDGIRAKGSDKLSFTALGSTDKSNEGTILAIQEFYKAIGVEITPDLEATTFYDKLLGKDYDLAYVSYTFAPDPDQSLAWSSTSQYNAWGYNSPKVDELLEDGLKSTDITERTTIYVRMQNQLLTDLPAAVLIYPERVTGVSKRVGNYTPTAVGYYWAIAYDAPTWTVSGS